MRLTSVALIVVVGLGAAGCGGDDAGADAGFGAPTTDAGLPPDAVPPSGASGGSSASAGQPATSDPAPGEPTADAGPAQPRLGTPFAFSSGLEVTVAEPEAFTPSDFVATGPGEALAFTVTVVNGGDDTWNPRHLKVTARSAGAAAEQVFDGPNGVVARPEERVPPGASTSFRVGFWVVDRSSLELGFTPGMDVEPVTILRGERR